MIGDRVVARTGCDHVEAAGTVDRVGARAAGDDIGRSGTGDRDIGGQGRGVDILEVRDPDGIADRLVCGGEIDRGGGLQNERIDAGAAVDGNLGPVVENRIVAGTGKDRIGPAAAVDGIGARTRRDRVGRGRTGHDDALRCIQDAGIDALEVGNRGCIANRLVDARRHAEVDACDAARRLQDERVGTGAAVDTNFCAVVGNRVVAGPRIDDIGTAAAINRIGARTARERVGRSRTGDRDALRCAQCRGIDILEPGDIDRVARGLVRIAEVDRRHSLEDERIGSRATVDGDFRPLVGDRVVTGTAGDHIGAAAAIDCIGACTARDDIGASGTGD